MNQPRGKSSGVFHPQTLDVDESIFDNNLKIVDGKDIDDTISGIFPGLTKNANVSASKQYKHERSKLFPQAEYPTVQVKVGLQLIFC